MAIYHFAIQVISRAKGRSSVAAAAYRSGSELVDERDGAIHDYTDKQVDHTEIMAPDDAPEWVHDRERLWNEVEKREGRVDSQLAREIRMALPVELSDRQQLKLVRRFLKREVVAMGMVADFAVHRDNPKNPHVHVMLTMRRIGKDGFGPKERLWNRKEVNERWRAGWAHEVNRGLQRAGHRARVDHRSFIARGIDLVPTIKVGVARFIMGARGKDLLKERTAKNDRAAFKNGEKICATPTVALKAITEHRAVFTRRELAIWLNTHTHGAEQHARAMSAVMCHPSVREAGRNRRHEEVFTTQATLDMEKQMLGRGEALARQEEHLTRADSALQKRLSDAWELSTEQRAAVEHIVQKTGGLALVEGVAGSGKSYMLDAVRDAYALEGRKVYGAALSGKAAEGLAEGSRIEDCRSLAGWEQSWLKGRNLLHRGDVLIVDEAGMVGTRQLSRVLDYAAQAEAKVVLVGDAEQLQAIEAGSPFRALCEQYGKAAMHEVRRQRVDWMKEATRELSRGEVAPALERYYEAGMVHGHKDKADALAEIMRNWEADERSRPGRSQMLLTHTRADAKDGNDVVHAMRKHLGKLGPETSILTDHGRRDMAVGDRIIFTKNDNKLGVRNGTLGTISCMEEGLMAVQLDGDAKKAVVVDTRTFKHFDHGYAVTVAKAQGVTVERAYVYASKGFDRHTAYVAMSRHKDRLDVYYAHTDFTPERGGLIGGMQRENRKRLALDHVRDHRAFTRWATEQERVRDVPQAHGQKPIRAGSLRDMAQRYEVAKNAAEMGPLSRRAAMARLPEIRALRVELKEALLARDFWVDKAKAWRREHPVKGALAAIAPIRGRLMPAIADPISKKTVGLNRGLEDAHERVALVREKLAALKQEPRLLDAAKELSRRQSKAFRQASQRRDFLQKSMERVRLRIQERVIER